MTTALGNVVGSEVASGPVHGGGEGTAGVVHQLRIEVPHRGADGGHVEAEWGVEVGDAREGDDADAIVSGGVEEAVDGVGGGDPAVGTDVGGEHRAGGVDGEDVGEALEFGLLVLLEDEGAREGHEDGHDREDEEGGVDTETGLVVSGVGPGAVGAARELPDQAVATAAGEEKEETDGQASEGGGGEKEGMTELHGERLRRISVRRMPPVRKAAPRPAGHW